MRDQGVSATSEPLADACRAACYITPTTIQAGTQCKAPPIGQSIVGCKHEHLDQGLLCADHHARWAAEGLICGTCQDIDGHLCEMHMTWTPFSAQ